MSARRAPTRTTRSPAGVEFPVDDVVPAEQPLDEVTTPESLRALLGDDAGPLEACSDYTRPAVARIGCQPLLEAVHRAYAEHRPLVLSPDHVWLAIAQGFAAHVNANAERLRPLLVEHVGKARLVVEAPSDTLLDGSPENDWPGLVVGPLSKALRLSLRTDLHDVLVPSFSTTGPLERTAFEVALLEAHQPYYDYECRLVCGIPWVRLEGTQEDWRRVRAHALQLERFDLGWWIGPLRRVLDQLVRTAAGSVDRAFWQRIYKVKKRYGGQNVSGWILELVPYLKCFLTGQLTVRNPVIGETGRDFTDEHFNPGGVSHASLPTGVSRVRVTIHREGGAARQVDVLAGFVGVAQDAATLALRPRIGWAVRPTPALDVALERIAAEHVVRPPITMDDVEALWSDLLSLGSFPGALLRLYTQFDGATLHANSESQARILPLRETGQRCRDALQQTEDFQARQWIEWCELADGSHLAMRVDGIEVARVTPTGEQSHFADDLTGALAILLASARALDLGSTPQ